jgi:hypothetical protein
LIFLLYIKFLFFIFSFLLLSSFVILPKILPGIIDITDPQLSPVGAAFLPQFPLIYEEPDGDFFFTNINALFEDYIKKKVNYNILNSRKCHNIRYFLQDFINRLIVLRN